MNLGDIMKYIGIDISKKTFDSTLLTNNKSTYKQFQNNLKGFTLLLKWINSQTDSCYICMEATGIYGIPLAKFLCDLEFKTIVANPYKIHSYAAMQMNRNKTDKADSLCIAKYCKYLVSEGEIQKHLYKPKSQYYQELQDLVTRLEQLKTNKNQEVNRLGTTLNVSCKKSIIKSITQIEKEIKAILKLVRACIKNDEELIKQVALLLTIDGIGEITAWAILAYLGDISLFSNSSQVASYSGTNPFIKESGTSLKSAKLSKMGNKRLRKALYMPAIVAKKYNPLLKIFYERLVNKGKPKKVAICAVMRKLLVISYGVLKSEKDFDQYYLNKKAS